MSGPGRRPVGGHDAPDVAVRLLGPVRVLVEGTEVGLGGSGPKSLFAVLAVRAGTVMALDDLVTALWGDRAPKSAGGGIYTYVSQLRKALAPSEAHTGKAGLLTSSRVGYCLMIPAGSVDLHRFETDAARARASWADQEPATALKHCNAALAAWLGPPLGGATGPFVDAERTRLELARLDLQELRDAALLETGSPDTAAAELAVLAEQHPLRERLHELLMLALYRTGRQAEALQAFQEVRHRLVDELGVEPGPALRRMHQLVLSAASPQDSLALVAPRPSGETPPKRHPAVVVPAELPHSAPGFIGRERELRQLQRLCAITDDDEHGRSVVISAIDGVGGVGKTALAVRAAHLLADSFPDGQLFVDLRGFDPRLPPVGPGDALGHLLRGLGADVEQLNDDDIDAKAALYRSILAGRRVLVLLDNAVSAEQVRPLLPGTHGCLTLVTSRDRLAGLAARDGAVRIDLNVLRPEESLELLRGSLGVDVVDGGLQQARALAALCGHLPLALRIAAERTTSSPHYELADIVRQLEGEHDRLDVLSLEDDDSAAVRAVFSWSYHALKPEQAQTFRLLGLHPGLQFGTRDAGALLGCSPTAAEAQLSGLVRRHLLEQIARDRYRFHDLIRIYAAECAEREEPVYATHAAVERLVSWFFRATMAVREVLTPGLGEIGPAPDPVSPPPAMRTYDEAISWANRELSTVADVLQLAVDRGFDAAAADLAGALGSLFYSTSRWAEWLRVIERGQAAARRVGDALSEGRLSNDRGLACYFLGRQDEAVACHRAAMDILTHIDEPHGQAVTANLAVAYMMLGRHLKAFPLLENALEIARNEGNLFVEAAVEDNLGAVLSSLDRHDEAIESGRRAVALIRRTSAEHMLGHTLMEVGESCLRAGRAREAVEHLGDALELWRSLGNIWGEISSMHALARAWQQAGDRRQARTLLLEALTIMRDSGRLAANERKAADIRALLAELGT